LAYVLDNLINAGYHDIVLVVGFKEQLMEDFKDDFIKNFPASFQHKLKIEIVDQHKILGPKEKEYGTACPVKCAKNIVGNENFIYLYGDNLFSVQDLESMNIDDKFCYVAGLEHENPGKYGVLIRDGEDFLEEIIEKPKEFVGSLINAGLYKFTPEVFEKLPLIEKSPRGEYEITDAISLLAKDRKVKIKKIKDYWLDFGNPEDIKKVSDFLKNESNKAISKSVK
jgi:UDP-N-acetylglucosamine diphosphorylase / glucose-1-phosphate thymidylyltransferase / UDP-N-acetylgalactosamine diphosphorylase / glucosamine-1-phosphate N-acetyltransferase / galactosamine-1-phosphate N-acetyltransferase